MKKVLCIHGIGYKDETVGVWSKKWETAIKNNLGMNEEVEFKFLEFDYLFKESRIRMGGIAYAEAIAKFIKSWVSSSTLERSKSFSDVIAAYAGMPAQFVTDKVLRQELFDLMAKTISEFKPDLIYAQSLGSLLAYDYLKKESVNGKNFPLVLLTSGSQISHPAILTDFGGQISTVNVKLWVNLHNEKDRVFAKRKIKITAQNFIEFETPFTKNFINHDAIEYLRDKRSISESIVLTGVSITGSAITGLGNIMINDKLISKNR
jgi:hypothetical protein